MAQDTQGRDGECTLCGWADRRSARTQSYHQAGSSSCRERFSTSAGFAWPPTIMMLTSVGQRGDAARCRELGVSAYLMKPVRQSELQEALTRVLSGREQRGSLPLVTRYSLGNAKGFRRGPADIAGRRQRCKSATGDTALGEARALRQGRQQRPGSSRRARPRGFRPRTDGPADA